MGLFHSPRIATSGLVFCFDAGNTKSYPGSGTTVRNVVNNNAGTLVNGPTFSSTNGGFFSFVTDDHVTFSEDSTLNTQTPTVEVWVKTNSTNQNGFWFEKGQVNTQYSLFQEGTVIQWRMNFGSINSLSTTTASFMNTSNWYQVVGTYTSGRRRLHINGVLVSSDSQTGTISTNTNGMSIGVYGGFNGSRGYYYNGNIATVRVYNRELTTPEILQNFNALRGRFGV